MTQGTTISLRMQSGVPVVEITGEWVSGVTERVLETMDRLAQAGHLVMVLNLRRSMLASVSALRGLGPAVQQLRQRHGRLEIVASLEQIGALTRALGEGRLRVSSSEARALSRIKGYNVRLLEPPCTTSFAPDRIQS